MITWMHGSGIRCSNIPHLALPCSQSFISYLWEAAKVLQCFNLVTTGGPDDWLRLFPVITESESKEQVVSVKYWTMFSSVSDHFNAINYCTYMQHCDELMYVICHDLCFMQALILVFLTKSRLSALHVHLLIHDCEYVGIPSAVRGKWLGIDQVAK